MTQAPLKVRRARADGLETLCALEVAGDGRFALVGLSRVRIGLLDGQAHIEQVSVDPAHAGHRIGRSF